MNKKIILPVLFCVLFSIWFNSHLIYTSFNKAPDGYTKPVIASSSTIWVPDNYTKIRWAIGNASAGDTIFVRAGTYYEHVIVNKALSLIGENKRDTIIDGNGTGIIVCVTANNINLSNLTIQNGELGIWLRNSNNNILNGITSLNNSYGIYLLGSSNNSLTGNNALNNWYGIYVDGSEYNTLTGNNASNNHYGLRFYHSDNNVLWGNNASKNEYGIYVGDSDNNVLWGNDASNNYHGIYVYYSDGNVLTGNNVTNNSQYGIRFSFSSNNVIFHNNFINNTEPLRSIDSVNSWDNGIEGNYWSNYPGTDANWDGIGDTPYPIDKNNKDNYPLIAVFLQFEIATENQSYSINAVCNSTISNFQCLYDPHTRTNAVSFRVDGAEGKGFCRIRIPHALIEPPYTITVDHNPPLYFKTVYTNGTHTWLYFAYDPSEREVTIMHMPYPEQLALSRWAILGLTVIVVILLSISIKYYRMFNEQKKVIQAYERELGSFPVSHPERARTHFIKDVIERKEKIEKFEKKYGIKIKPANTFEDLVKKLGVEKEVKN